MTSRTPITKVLPRTFSLSLSLLSFISFRHFSFFHPKIRFFPSVSHLRSFLHLFRDHRSSFFFREFQILAFNLNGILTRVSSKRSISPRNHPLNSELISWPGWKKRIFLLHILTSLFCCVSRNTAQRTYVRSSSTPLIVPISHPLFYADRCGARPHQMGNLRDARVGPR